MDYKSIYRIKKENEAKILKVCPRCPNTSGIYFILRQEYGMKFGYIGKAKHLLERLGSHLSGRTQWIDRSLYKHGLYSDSNPCGYQIHFLEFPEEELNDKEQHYIRMYANAGYQLRNIETGGQQGKTDMGGRKPNKGYYDGLEQGKKNIKRQLQKWFSLHLDVSLKKQNKNAEKALQRFKEILEEEL